MKIKYALELEEIQTCNSCPLCHFIDDGSMRDQDYCAVTKASVTNHCYENTKPDTCPLIILE